MDLYVMRHGQTVWNAKGITQGRRSNRLSRQGVQVTQKVAREIKNVPFEVIYSSPLMRTIQTANIVNQYHKVKVIRDEDLNEIKQGIFSGRKKNSLSPEEKMIKSQRSKSAGMESYEECYVRAKNFVERLKKTNFKHVLVITHDRVAAFIEDIVLGKNPDFSNIKDLRRFQNSEIIKLEFNVKN